MLPLSKRLELFTINAIPSLLAIFFAFIYLVPKHVDGLSSIMPLLPLVPLFYWGLTQPLNSAYWVVVFVIGLVFDATQGGTLGLSSLLYMLFLYLIHSQRKYMIKEGFLVRWAYLAVLLLVVIGLNWLLLSWLNSQPMPWLLALLQWCVTVACYPLMHKFFDVVDQYMHDRRWQIMHGR